MKINKSTTNTMETVFNEIIIPFLESKELPKLQRDYVNWIIMMYYCQRANIIFCLSDLIHELTKYDENIAQELVQKLKEIKQ